MASEPQVDDLRHRLEEMRIAWTPEWEAMATLNPRYLDGYLKIKHASQSRQRLPAKIQELCFISIAASVTHIHTPAIKAHIQAALAAGATKDEIFEVIGLTYLLGVHTVTLGFPILEKLAAELNIPLGDAKFESASNGIDDERQRIKDKFVADRGFWPPTFEIILQLDPQFFEQYASFSAFSSKSPVLEAKYREVIICAFDAATTHLYARGTEIHMRNALKLGATPAEIVEMLEITSLMGIDGVLHSAPLLLEQLSAQK